MTTLVGAVQVDRFTVVDAEGVLITNATFTVDQAIAPNGQTFTPTITTLGSGMYQVGYVLPQAGIYYLRLVTQNLTPFQVYEFQWHTDEYLLGDTVTSYFTVRTNAGAYYGGSTVTVSLAADPIGSVFAATITDLLNGLYRVQWETPRAGVYTLRLSATVAGTGNTSQVFEFEERVFPVPVVAPVLISSLGATLDELVRDVALACKDYLNVMATEDAPDAITWKDGLQLSGRSPKSFKGASLYVWQASDPDNVGAESRIVDSVDGGLVLQPPLPSAPRLGDRAYVTNLESQGFTRDTYVEQINAHIEYMFPDYTVPAYWAFPTAFDGASPFLTPPVEFTHITAIGWNTAGDAGRLQSIPPSSDYMDGWGWDDFAGRIVIYGRWRDAAHGAPLQIRGFGPAPRLENPADMTPINAEYLVQSTAADLIMSLRDARRQAEGAWHANRADALRVKAIRMLPSGTIRIR